MTRNSVLIRFQSRMPLGSRVARLLRPLILTCLASAGTGWPSDARAAAIFRDLTAQDRSQPILLTQTGAAISLTSSGHLASDLSAGAMPAYLAFPLLGGEHLPADVPTVATGPQPGENAVGPLGLTPTTQAQLNTDLTTSPGVIVNAPDESYAVAMLPRYARALAAAGSSSSTASGGDTPTSVIASMFGLNPKADWTINGIPSSDLSKWLNSGSTELSHLTSLGVDGLSKALGIKGLAGTSTSSQPKVEAQELLPPASAEETAAAPQVVAPEPGAWLVFGVILGAAGLRCWSGSSSRNPHPQNDSRAEARDRS
jgi:hypothetical protein